MSTLTIVLVWLAVTVVAATLAALGNRSMSIEVGRPEIIEEINKLSSASLTKKQAYQLYSYLYNGSILPKELRNIANLPGKAYVLKPDERRQLIDILEQYLGLS